MARMTKEERQSRKEERQVSTNRMKAAHEKAITVVRMGKCPDCGCGLKRNLAITGWWQCEQYGTVGFRKDSSKPSCGFQCFTC